MTRMLVSVRDEEEAQIGLQAGADIIDFKQPSAGALGALPVGVIERGVRAVAGRAPTSATAGDWPLDPALLSAAVARIGETNVDYVKLGLLPGDRLAGCIEALAPLATRFALVAVFFGDRGVPLEVLALLRAAGFAGAMIDTFDKRGRGLRQHMSDQQLQTFVDTARDLRLMTGLAGSLQLDDIAPMASLSPDLLGFRGAVCEPAGREAALSPARLRAVRAALERAYTARTTVDT